jgi:hypothetical protein
MSTEPKKVPPRIHKAPKRYADEQDTPGPAKKKKGTAGSAEKTTTTTLEKPTQKKNHQSALNIQRPKPRPTVQKRITVTSEVEDVGIPGERQQSAPILSPICGGDGSEKHLPAGHESDQEDNDIELLEEPAESAEMELSSSFFFYLVNLN